MADPLAPLEQNESNDAMEGSSLGDYRIYVRGETATLLRVMLQVMA